MTSAHPFYPTTTKKPFDKCWESNSSEYYLVSSRTTQRENKQNRIIIGSGQKEKLTSKSLANNVKIFHQQMLFLRKVKFPSMSNFSSHVVPFYYLVWFFGGLILIFVSNLISVKF
ncbi:unnamed protein product [Ilex paraguariensis]|uniref:Uncharacterized protein n=1 Tax=Ilex paraguariensis TaxID=185542 RepID=A0ABC8S0M6_9AQUA